MRLSVSYPKILKYLSIYASLWALVNCGSERGNTELLPDSSSSPNRKPIIYLNGDAVVTLNVGDSYVEMGAEGDDPEDGDISGQIVVDSSSMDTSQAGTYSVTYNLVDSQGTAATEITRNVIVHPLAKNKPPSITLMGSPDITLFVGDIYIELGAEGEDPEDGNISDQIVIDHSAVNTSVVGVYSVSYNLEDSEGREAATVIRYVSVVEREEDATCSLATILCVGPGEVYDTNQGIENAFNAAFSVVQAGDTIKIRGGTYRHTSDSDHFITVAVSGTETAPITIQPSDGESVLIEGFGFAEGKAAPENPNEKLIVVTGDYIHIRRLELANATRNGLEISGRYGVFEDLVVRDSWLSNVLVVARTAGTGNEIEGNVLRRIETYRSRHGAGIVIGIDPKSSKKNLVKNTLIEDSISYLNGYQPNGEKVPGVVGDSKGGENSDGIATSRLCHDDGSAETSKIDVVNLCPNTVLRNNIVWRNAANGFEIALGSESILENNIAFDNGPQGNKGFSVLRLVLGGLSFIGNIAMSNGAPLPANSHGFELRYDSDSGQAYVYHNVSIDNRRHGMTLKPINSSDGEALVYNNLSLLNGGGDLEDKVGVHYLSNWTTGDGDAMLTNSTFDKTAVTTTFAMDWSVAEKHASIRQQFVEALTPQEGSPLVDQGTWIAEIHCATADDDITNPMPADANCRHWNGSAPDIGAYER